MKARYVGGDWRRVETGETVWGDAQQTRCETGVGDVAERAPLEPSRIDRRRLGTLAAMHSLLRRGWIEVDDLAAAVRDYVVVDVRGAQAFEDGHVAGALCLGHQTLIDGWNDPDPRLPVAVFAEHDDDALAVAELLMRQGRDAVAVRGGAHAWRAAGLCLVRNRRS